MKWFKSEPDSHLTEAVVAAEDIIAPELLLAELTYACWSAAGGGMLTPAQVAGALRHYLTLLHLIAPLARRAVHIALTLDHPACDCFYLARAEREAVPLVTADRRLIARLTGTAWAGIVIDLATYTLRP